jgi:hypothetical protein
MHLNEPSPHRAVTLSHIYIASFADIAVYGEGCRPVPPVSFVPVRLHPHLGAFGQTGDFGQFDRL